MQQKRRLRVRASCVAYSLHKIAPEGGEREIAGEREIEKRFAK